MNETQNNIVEGQPQPKYRDRLFIAIFGKDNERSKRWRLDLYNVLNRTNYTDPNALTLIRDYNASPEVAAQKMGAPLDKVLEALKEGAPA